MGRNLVARIAISLMLLCVPAATRAEIASADPSDDPVVAAAGDIAGPWDDDEATAALLDAIDPSWVLPLGDMVYPDGTAADFAAYYDPTWGRHKWRSRPVAGNHDYHVPGAADYFSYFGAAAGDPANGYYAYDLGRWRLYALNTNCGEVACREGSEQLDWLRADLAANADRCTLVYTHYPRFSSHVDAGRRDYTPVSALYQAFHSASGDVWLGAHNHFYERLAQLDPSGAADPGRGIRTFIVGTGGANTYAPGAPRAGSEVAEGATHGVIKLQLHANSYDWEFVPEAGKTFTDSGTETCEPDTVAPTPPEKVEAVTVGPTRVDLRWSTGQDDVEVTGYEVYRDGRRIAATTGETSYSDLTAAPGTDYAYTVAARDTAGNVSSPSGAAKARTDSADARTFAPVADARVAQASPDSAFPTGSLRVDGGVDPALESYLRFAVEGLGGAVKSARLRVFATTATSDGPAVYAAGDGWTETGLTWNSRPARGEVALADRGAIVAGSWVEYDVTAAITGDGSYSFALIGTSSDGVQFSPRESSLPPRLLIETAG